MTSEEETKPEELVCESAHNECVMCGTHIPDNKDACWPCIKNVKKGERQFIFDVFGDKQNLAGAIDATHNERREHQLRYWPK